MAGGGQDRQAPDRNRHRGLTYARLHRTLAGLCEQCPEDLAAAILRFLEIGAATSLLFGFACTKLAYYHAFILFGWLARGVASQLALLEQEPAQTARVLGALALKAVLAFTPLILAVRRWPRHRLLWLPVPVFLGLLFVGVSLILDHSAGWWAAYGATSLLAGFLAWKRSWFVWPVLPWGCLLLPLLSHVYGPLVYDEGSLREKCSRNDGVRAENVPRSGSYFAVTPFKPDLWLLTGLEPDAPLVGMDRPPVHGGGSFWLADRGRDGVAAVLPSAAMGNLWRGCVLDDHLWFVRVRNLVRVRWSGVHGESEEFMRFVVPVNDMDVSEVACDPRRRVVYFGEATQGGLWRFSLEDQRFERWQIGGGRLGLFPRVREDGRLVIASTDELLVLDPETRDIVERHPAGYFVHGLDLCPRDGAAAVADLAGRVRIFRRAQSGGYRLAQSTDVRSARRVAFSPDCRFFAITGFDQEDAIVVEAETGRVIRRFCVGPMVRDVVFVAARRLVVADACSATVLDF